MEDVVMEKLVPLAQEAESQSWILGERRHLLQSAEEGTLQLTLHF